MPEEKWLTQTCHRRLHVLVSSQSFPILDGLSASSYDSFTINATKMSKLTLESIAALLKEELGPIKQKLEEHSEILSQHSAALVELSSDVKSLLDQRTVTEHRVERLEHWGKEVGQKVGVKLEL